jgi:hypothetical protein
MARGLPLVETKVSGALRQNDHSIASAPFYAVPGSFEFFEADNSVSVDGGVKEYRDTEDGTVYWSYVFDGAIFEIVYDPFVTWACAPEDWYEGSSRVEVEVDGLWLPVVAPTSLDSAWRMSNGMARVTVDGDEFSFEWWDSSAWSTPVAFNIDIITGAFGAYTWSAPRLTHVGPESCTVAVSAVGTAGPTSSLICHSHITLRRGTPFTSATFSATEGVEIRAASPTAVTDGTSRMYRTAAVAGWRWIVATPYDNVVDTANGIMAPNDPANGPIVSVGFGATHSSWTGQRVVADAHFEWFAVTNTRTEIGVRL